MKRFAAVLLVLSIFGTVRAEAHGTEGWLEEGSGIRLVARYDDGEPMRHARVGVTCQDQSGANTIIFQTGYTDRNGLFVFVPDAQGKFRATVQDEMGHQLVLGTTVDGSRKMVAPARSASAAGPHSADRPLGIVAGIAMILGLGGMVYGWRQKKLCNRETAGGLQGCN